MYIYIYHVVCLIFHIYIYADAIIFANIHIYYICLRGAENVRT